MTLLISNKLPIKHPGFIFNERILMPHKISQVDAAESLQMNQKQISLFVNGETSVSISLARKLEISTGITSCFWLNIQKKFDLYMASNKAI